MYSDIIMEDVMNEPVIDEFAGHDIIISFGGSAYYNILRTYLLNKLDDVKSCCVLQNIQDVTAISAHEYYTISRENANKQAHIDSIETVKAGVNGKLIYDIRGQIFKAFNNDGTMIRQTKYINQYFIHVDIDTYELLMNSPDTTPEVKDTLISNVNFLRQGLNNRKLKNLNGFEAQIKLHTLNNSFNTKIIQYFLTVPNVGTPYEGASGQDK